MQSAVSNLETSMVAVIGMELEQIEKEISQIENTSNNVCEIANDNYYA